MRPEETRKLSREKEQLFADYAAGKNSFQHTTKRIYEIDHPSTPVRTLLKLAVAAILPALFISSSEARDDVF